MSDYSDYEDDFIDEEHNSSINKIKEEVTNHQKDLNFLLNKIKLRDNEILNLKTDLSNYNDKLKNKNKIIYNLQDKIKSIELNESKSSLKTNKVSLSIIEKDHTVIKKKKSQNNWSEHNTLWSPHEIEYNDLELKDIVSGGGFCVMYRGLYLKYINVAIKRIFDPKLTDKLKEEFYNEVRILSLLRHQNIVQLIGAVFKPPSLCIVTEYMKRGSLFHVLHQSNITLDLNRKLKITKDITNGLYFIHYQQIIHRDIKSYNVLVDEYLNCKICDFGMALFIKNIQNENSKHLELYSGTPQYMAMELLDQSGIPSYKSDIYAYGILLWEIWSRNVPYDGLDISMIKKKVLEKNQLVDLDLLDKNTPNIIKNIIKKSITKNIDQRISIYDIIPEIMTL